MRGARILVVLVGGVLGAIWLARTGPERVGRASGAEASREREAPPSSVSLAPSAQTAMQAAVQADGSERIAFESATADVEGAAPASESRPSRALAWFGRIVDAQSGAPLAVAEVVRVVGDDPGSGVIAGKALSSDAQGSVELSFASGTPSRARVALEGYATVFALLDEGHGEPARARRVPLSRDAHLQVLVRGADGAPASGLTTSVAIAPWQTLADGLRPEDKRWSRLTDDSGLCVFEQVSASVLLSVAVLEGDRRRMRQDFPLRLEPGESRVLSLTVGGACTIDGLVLEADGSAAPGVDVWLIPRGGNPYLAWRQEEGVVARTQSDAHGRFTLPDVTLGTWRVGIAPEMPRVRVPRSDRSRADGTPLTPESYELSPPDATRSLAPMASEVVVTAEQTHAEVTLTCWRGLYIRGRVVGFNSELVDGAFVTAKGAGLLATDKSHLLGFSLGPLPPGSYQISALRVVKPYGEAQPVTAGAGADDVVLQLGPDAMLTVAVLDSQGSPASGAQVWFFPEGGVNDWRSSTAREDGKVGMRSALGRWTVTAAIAAGEYGWTSGVEVDRDGPTELELHLRPGARLRVVVPPALERHGGAQIRQDGRLVGLFPITGGNSAVVPAGELEVELFRSRMDPGESLERRTVHTVEGQETVVEFAAVSSAK